MTGMPAARATVAHVSNAAPVNGSATAKVFASTSESRSSGCATAYSWAMAPPIDTPARWKRGRPSPVTSALRSAAISPLVYGPGGWPDRPTPRLS